MSSDDEDFSDGDAPPPLDDLSEQVQAIRDHRTGGKGSKSESETKEEARLKRRMTGEALLKIGQLEAGELVGIHNLKSAKGKTMNGKTAKIVSYSSEAERYVIQVSGGKKMRIRPGNLQVLLDERDRTEFQGRIRAGFLEGKNLSSGAAESSGDSSMPFVSKADTSRLHIPEVQASMAKDKKNKKWVTPELMKHLGKNKTLVDGMKDPRMVRAIREFSEKPKEALKKYQNDEKIVAFFKAFMQQTKGFNDALKGVRDSMKPAEKKAVAAAAAGARGAVGRAAGAGSGGGASGVLQQPIDRGDSMQFSTQDGGGRTVSKATLQQWMSNPYIRQVLGKPETAQMIAHCRSDPNAFAKYKDTPEMKILVRAGIIMPPS